MDCGKKIAALRKSKNMTQEDLGKVLSVTYQAVSKWERGESLPDFEMMSRIAKFFNVPLNYFSDDEEGEQKTTTAEAAPAAEIVGMCTQCGKMLTEEEIAQKQPKIICKSCSERLKAQEEQSRKAFEASERARKDKAIYEQRGYGINFSLFFSAVVAIALYVGLSIFCSKVEPDDRGAAAALLFFIPLALFGAVQAFCSFVKELKDDDFDEEMGYSRNVSLITAAVFSLINFACFIALYATTKDTVYIIFLAISMILSFTFVSQFMWGGVVKTVFTLGGFTFKLPGFIITLDIDSILWMIIVKFLLGILAAIIFIITTVIITLVSMFVSVITFIPSVLHKSVKDKQVEKENQ